MKTRSSIISSTMKKWNVMMPVRRYCGEGRKSSRRSVKPMTKRMRASLIDARMTRMRIRMRRVLNLLVLSPPRL